jgi:FkbM family methyltransferase
MANPNSTQRSPIVTVALKAFISLCLVLTAALTALNFVPGLAILASTRKYSPYCSGWQAAKDARIKLDQLNVAAQILKESRVIRTEGGRKLWSTPAGEYWVPDTNDQILSMLLAQQRRKIYGSADSGGVRPGDIVLDCGAHIGTYVKTALDAGAEKVVAIDPSPEALECLRLNFAKETASGRVIIYPKGVWDEEKQLVLFANGNGAAGDSFVTEGTGARRIADIPVTTIDKIVKELGLPRVNIIKADVKGSSERMLKGASETLKSYHPRVVISTEEETDDPVKLQATIAAIDPSYQFTPGPCLLDGAEVRTDVVFFK